MDNSKYDFAAMAWPDIKKVKSVILPIGSVEQHGLHLPLATDAIIAQSLSVEAGRRLKIPVLPTLYYSHSPEHMGFPGTITISKIAFLKYLSEICNSLERSGIKRIFIVNGHGGNCRLLDILEKRAKNSKSIVIIDAAWEIVEGAGIDTKDMCHADELETSLLLYLRPKFVRTNKTVDEFPLVIKRNMDLMNWHKYTKSGTVGYPSRSSRNKGNKYFHLMLKQLMKKIEQAL